MARAHRQLALTYKGMKDPAKARHHEELVRRLYERMGISEPKAKAG